jgi:hypothetical protein
MYRSNSSRSRGSRLRLLLASVLLLGAGALLTASPATAQEGLSPPSASDSVPAISGQVNLRGTVGVPRGGLRDNISGLGGGLHAYIGGWTGQSPFMIGLDLGILNYGRTTDQVPFSSTVGPRVPVEVNTNNNVLETHLSLRLQPRTGRFRPYIEGLAGFKYLFTRTTIGDDDIGEDDFGDDIAESTNYDDFALSGGAGAGIDVRVYQQRKAGKTVRAVSVHLGVQYLLGQEAEYLAEGELTDENENGQLDQSELDIRRSRTTFLQPQFGVTLRLADTD